MLQKVAHFVENDEKLSIRPNLGTFRTNYHVSRFGWTFRKKVAKSGSSREKPRKIIDLNKTSNLSSKLSCFYEIFGQKFKKVAHFVKNHEKSSIWPKLATFRANYYLSRFRWTFRKKVAKSGSFREKPSKMIDLTKTGTFSSNLSPFDIWMNFFPKSCKNWLISTKSMKNHRFGQNWEVFEQTMTFQGLHKLFGKKLQKVAHFVRNHDKSSIWPKLETFRTNYHVSRFGWTFSKKVAKLAHLVKNQKKASIWPKLATFQANYHISRFPWNFRKELAKSYSFREKPWKIIDLAKTGNFSSKLSCFDIWMNFSEKSCKNWLVSWKTMKNDQFGTNFSRKLSPFEVSTNFSEKICKKWLISWKTAKNQPFGQNLQPSKQTITFRGFHEIFGQKFKKVAHLVKNHEKSSIWPKLATFRANYYLSRFRWTFRKKVAKSGSFREKSSKIIDLTKTGTFSSKLSRFEVLMNFSQKSCKKWLISWKIIKNRRSKENWQLFEQTITFSGFDELFGEMLQKVAHFVKNHEKFGQNWELFEQTITFRGLDELFGKKLQKVAHFVKKHDTSSIWPKLETFRRNYDVSRFGWTFRKKVAKLAHFVKNHEKPSIWPKLESLQARYYLSRFRLTFRKKVAKSGSFREKQRKIIDLAKTGNLSSKLSHFDVSVKFLGKKLKKVARFVKNHEKSSIWPKLATLRANYHLSRFQWTFRKKLQKVALFLKNHQKSSIWPKLATFRANYHVSTFGWTFRIKVAKRGSFRLKP